MKTTPTTKRLPQYPQAVERLLEAIAASPDYQRDGLATYQPSPHLRGRWQAGQHSCGNNTIHTAVRNKLVTVEVAGPNVRALALTEDGHRHVHARQARKADAR
ncbi:hypothetical protein AB0J43_02755 [Nonomuraea fuscirosea]